MTHPLRDRNFRILFAGRVVDAFGDAVSPVALTLAVVTATRSSVGLAVILVCGDPTATKTVGPLLDRLSKKFGVPIAQARSMEEGMAKQAASEGLPYAVDRPVSGTFDMLRLVHLGAEHGVAWEYLRSMQTEVFSGNFDAFAHDTLVRIGESLGIPADEIRDVLATDRYTDAVHADHDAAVNLGARGVPFTVLGNRLGIPGAASVDQYQDAINQAWDQVNG